MSSDNEPVDATPPDAGQPDSGPLEADVAAANSEALQPPPAEAAATVGSSTLADMLAGPELPTEEVLERAEAKPPRYRLVRGAIYTTYMVLVAWFCIGVTVAVWRAVWGPDGANLQAHEAQHGTNLKNCRE